MKTNPLQQESPTSFLLKRNISVIKSYQDFEHFRKWGSVDLTRSVVPDVLKR